MHGKRPIIVTIIAWYLIIIGLAALLKAALAYMPYVQKVAEEAGLSLSLVLIVHFTAILTVIVSAIAMLKGLNWGRLLYLIYQPVMMVYSATFFGFRRRDIVDIIIFLAILVLLTRPMVSTFFRSDGERKKPN